jgi:hypothetical protein
MRATIPALLLLAASSGTFAQTSATHTVTVLVPEENSITVTGGDIALNLSPPLDGSPITATSDACDLVWRTNSGRPLNIYVQSDLVAPRYRLTVVGQNLVEIASDRGNSWPGTLEPPALLAGGASTLFVRRIRRVCAMCDLLYTATASLGDGFGTDVHTVTYTLTR